MTLNTENRSVVSVILESVEGATHLHGPSTEDAISCPKDAVHDAFETPIGYPPLSQAVFSGDLVAIAFEVATPNAVEIAQGILKSLLSVGVADSDITLLFSLKDKSVADEVLSQLDECEASGAQVVLHDPTQEDACSYLGDAGKENVFMATSLCNADVVISVGVVRPMGKIGAHGIHTAIYPTFASTETLERFSGTASLESPVQAKRRKDEADQAAKLLGVSYVVQVMPSSSNRISEVLAGAPNATETTSWEKYNNAWHQEPGYFYPLAIAILGDGTTPVSWDDFARGLESAMACVEDGGAIAICGSPSEKPNAALSELAKDFESTSTVERIHRCRSIDARAAWMLTIAKDRGPVYLLSELNENLVEEWGVTPIGNVQELARLANRYEDFILLENAEHLSISKTDSDDELLDME